MESFTMRKSKDILNNSRSVNSIKNTYISPIIKTFNTKVYFVHYFVISKETSFNRTKES